MLLDGFDLGVGILFGLTRDETSAARDDERGGADLGRQRDLARGRPAWSSGAPFRSSMRRCSPAFYLPLLLMLAGLILRGVAFEYRYKTRADAVDLGRRLCRRIARRAAFMQGLTVGALVEGLPITNGQYAGGEFGWFSPFAVLCGIGLCLGYALLGACWLVKKCEADVREAALSPDPVSVGWTARFPGRRLRLCAGRTPSGHAADGSSGRICLSSRRSASIAALVRPRAFGTAGMECRSTWSH